MGPGVGITHRKFYHYIQALGMAILFVSVKLQFLMQLKPCEEKDWVIIQDSILMERFTKGSNYRNY
jgi:hypothetical protein